MENLSRKDKAILNAVFEHCADEVSREMEKTNEDVIGIMMPVGHEATPVMSMKDDDAYKEMIVAFLRKIEGWRLLAKELHWSTKSDAEHRLTDSVVSTLEACSDDIAEDFMGSTGIRIVPGMLKPIMCEPMDTESLVKDIMEETEGLRGQIEGKAYGMGSVLDDMIKSFDKYTYKAPMR